MSNTIQKSSSSLPYLISASLLITTGGSMSTSTYEPIPDISKYQQYTSMVETFSDSSSFSKNESYIDQFYHDQVKTRNPETILISFVDKFSKEQIDLDSEIQLVLNKFTLAHGSRNPIKKRF